LDGKNGEKMRKFGIKQLVATALISFSVASAASGAVLKLADAPLSQLIELYAKEKNFNIFLDESVQSHRKITAHLNGLDMDEAFKVVLKTINLETCSIGENTLIVFPPEKASRYRNAASPVVLQVPEGLNTEWLSGMLRNAMPGLKISALPGNSGKIVILGSEDQVAGARKIAAKLPETEKKNKVIEMSKAEAILAVKELNLAAEVISENGIELNSENRNTIKKVEKWRSETRWGNEVFYPENLDFKQISQISSSMKSRASVADLGNTGACFIEGPVLDRKRLVQVFNQLDKRGQIIHKEIQLGDIDIAAAKAAIMAALPKLKAAGDRNLVLIGKPDQIEQAEKILDALGKKRKQVLISFKLAEVSRSKLKKLGIDLDKTTYGYDEIKQFHDKDTLPLLLRVLNEGKDAKILAEPNLRVIEGEEAKVTIGDRIPLEVEANATTDSGSVLKLNTQLQWVDVGIKMTVKDVNVGPKSGINMKIKGEVSSVVTLTKQGYPQIRTREAESSLRVQNGDSIIMGGLINKEERETRTKIPIIGNIPLFGGLGRGRDREKTDNEIVMVVTAKLISD
jgi:type II secretory pathway component GspD/PulD (secretin)